MKLKKGDYVKVKYHKTTGQVDPDHNLFLGKKYTWILKPTGKREIFLTHKLTKISKKEYLARLI